MKSSKALLAGISACVIAVSIAGLPGLPGESPQKITAGQTVSDGLNTVVFNTPAGKLNVNLPEDMAAGDVLSGTVIAEPDGANNEEIASHSSELQGYVVEIRKAEEAPVAAEPAPSKAKKTCPKTCSSDPGFTCFLPAATRIVEICLTHDGKPVCTKPVKVPGAPGATCPHDSCQIPPVMQCGRPAIVHTSCDGRFASSRICVGGSNCRVLAKSPRGIIFRSPHTIIGPTEVEVVEGTHCATGRSCNIAVKLTATKTTLRKSESAAVTVTVYGLEGIKLPLQLHLENLTPQTVTVDGGNDQSLTISPQG